MGENEDMTGLLRFARRETRGDDLIGALVRDDAEAPGLSPAQALNFAVLLLLGGSETTKKTYKYKRAWVDHPVDSSKFNERQGHGNPQMTWRTRHLVAPNIKPSTAPKIECRNPPHRYSAARATSVLPAARAQLLRVGAHVSPDGSPVTESP